MGRKRKKAPGAQEAQSGSRQQTASRRRNLPWFAAVAVAVAGLVALIVLLDHGESAVASPIEFHDVRAQTQEFMGYFRSIELDAEQERVKQEALAGLEAPCCSDNSAYTCCCPCNMAKSWWGLSHHLIATQGYGAGEVRAAVEGWIEFINPHGFSGDACYTGGCGRPFHRNGCGGMDERSVVF